MSSKGFKMDQPKTDERKSRSVSCSPSGQHDDQTGEGILNDTKLSEDSQNTEAEAPSDNDETEEEGDPTLNDKLNGSTLRKSFNIPDKTSPPKSSSEMKSQKWKYILFLVFLALFHWGFKNSSDTFSSDNNWRENVDPHHKLSSHQRHIIFAALKPIHEKSYVNEQETVSTLLILSSNEEYAANLARCILKLVNTETLREKISTEIDLRSYHGDKLRLDSNLKSLLMPGGAIRAVVLRHIDDISSNNAFEQLRLLFAYCDGENPAIPNRLIIMTAMSTSQNEIELREKFKTRWSKEHDFVDALMSRISGHTIFIDDGQKSIC